MNAHVVATGRLDSASHRYVNIRPPYELGAVPGNVLDDVKVALASMNLELLLQSTWCSEILLEPLMLSTSSLMISKNKIITPNYIITLSYIVLNFTCNIHMCVLYNPN